MKKIIIIIIVGVAGLMACHNSEKVFDDFIYTSGYFPYQYPVRTLILGDYIYPNDNDNAHKFLISVAMGGVYTNNQDRVFNFELAPDLCNNVNFAATDEPIHLMPQSYYSLSSQNQITIPSGKVNAGVEVQLKDAFFDDPLAIKMGYVIPLRILNVVNIDTVLRGKTNKLNPDPRIGSDWDILPKDFTMFAIKFINPYHGNYLHRGVSVVKDASSVTIETTPYRARYAEQNEIWTLVTTGKNSVTVSGNLRSTIITGTLKMDMTFDDNGNCTIKEAEGSAYTITGNGRFMEDTESWGGSLHDGIYITYQLTSGANTYFATDSLAIRDRAVVMELYTPEVVIP